MKTREHAEETVIESAPFSHEMVQVAKGAKQPTSKYLTRLVNHIKRTGAKQLWFPIHVNSSHWIAGRVDLERHTFAFGEFIYVRMWLVM